MDDSFYDEQFDARALTPAIWVLTAGRLKRSADIVFDLHERDLKDMEAGASPLGLQNLELAGCITMLSGLAIENLLKAYIVQAKPNAVVNGRLRKWPKDGHDLFLLCEEAQISLDNSEKDLLTRLAAFVRWAGKYPIPKSASEMRLQQSAVQPDSVPLPFSPHERSYFDAFYGRLEALIIKPSCV
jgi:hypothetical protein